MINPCLVAYRLGRDADRLAPQELERENQPTCCSLDLNRRDEPIAPPRNGFDESGITRIIPKSFPDLEYRHSQALIEFDKGILGPKSVPNLFPRNNLSGAFDKQYQKSERLFLQAHTDRSTRKCAISRVKHVKPETVADFRGRRMIWSRCRHTSGEILRVEFSTKTS